MDVVDMNTSIEISSNDGFNSTDHFKNTTADLYPHENWIYIISVLFCLPTNSYVIWLIVTGTGNGLSAEFFSLNLSVCEIILCLYSLLGLLEYKFEIPLIVWSVATGLIITGRPVFHCLMCVERYLAVVHPVTFLKFKPLRYRVICSVIAWMAAFVTSVALTVIWSLFFIKLYICYMLSQFIFFFCIQLFCLVAVLRALKQSGPRERVREGEEENHMKRRAFHLILITTVSMVIMYAPYIIVWLLYVFLSGNIDLVFSIAYACYAMPSLVLPFLFLHRVGKLPFIKCQ